MKTIVRYGENPCRDVKFYVSTSKFIPPFSNALKFLEQTTTPSNFSVLLTQSKPDVLLSDIGMPDVDGYMLIQQVRTLLAQGDQIKVRSKDFSP
ncbi:hypothetical protein LC612_12165 [Nostoc sp. CHAB 5834]|nr:hypothetical protein [Nostoc sp. CHAB 5834]